MKKLLIVVAVLMMCMPVLADVSFVFGDSFSGVEVGKRLGFAEVGTVAAVDYFGGGNSLSYMDIDTGGYLIGPNLKCHFTPKDCIIDPFIAASWLFRNGKVGVHDGEVTYEAGIMVKVWNSLSIGASYLKSDDLPEDDYIMLRVSPWQF